MTDVDRDLEPAPPVVETARLAATPAPEVETPGCGDVFLALPLEPVVGTASAELEVEGTGVLLPSLACAEAFPVAFDAEALGAFGFAAAVCFFAPGCRYG